MLLRPLLFAFLSLIAFQLNGQVMDDLPSLEQDSLSASATVDSGYIHKINLLDLSNTEDLTNFIVPADFRQYDPARKSDSLFAHLGSPASAAFGLFKIATIQHTFDLGLHQYNLYKSDQKYFFEQSIPYSHLYFSPGQTQDHTSLHAIFSRTFKDTYGISFDYNNLNDIGWYKNQAVKLNGLNTSFWFRPPDKRWSFHLRYNAQTNVEAHNGGVSDPSLYNVPGYELRTLIPIYLNGAVSRLQQRRYDLDIFYKLIHPKINAAFNPYLHYESQVENLLFKFFDEDIEDEIDFYGETFGQYAGLRHFLTQTLYKNTATLHIDWSDKMTFTAGIAHHYHNIYQEPKDISVNDLYAIGKLNISLFKQSSLRIDAHIGAFDALGEYAFQANLHTNLSAFGDFEASLLSQNKRPSLLSNNLYINQSSIRNNDFGLYNETRLSFKYHQEKLGFTAVYAQHYIYNAIYFDANKAAVQSTNNYLLTQFQVHENLKLKWFHFDNAVFYQIQNERLYPLPNLYSIHSMYVRRFLFKSVMDFKGGADLRYIFDYKPPAFDPLTANFYLQNDFTAKAYPALDVFVEGKVDNFALFIKVENTLAPLLNDQFFMIKDHPQFDLKLRLGFVWQLWN
jgi:hypothetical protein